MRKKLNLTLREPVKIHEEEDKNVSTLPKTLVTKIEREVEKKSKIIDKSEIRQKVPKSKSPKVEKNLVEDNEDIRKNLPLRVQQIWEYFCLVANQDGDLKNRFEVTRAEVMEKAGIGSTNTYRNALKKFEELNLIEIEYRPGVTSGSVFHLTELGLKQAKNIIDLLRN